MAEPNPKIAYGNKDRKPWDEKWEDPEYWRKKINEDPRIPASEKEATFRQHQLESGFRRDVMSGERPSRTGALGYGQFLKSTMKDYPHDFRNPEAGYNASVQYTQDLAKQFNGNWSLARLAYNQGPGRIRSWLRSGGDPNKLSAEALTYDKVTNGGQTLSGLGNNLANNDYTPPWSLRPNIPTMNLSDVLAALEAEDPEYTRAVADRTASEGAMGTATEEIKKIMGQTWRDYAQKPEYSDNVGLLGRLGSNIASALSGSPGYREDMNTMLQADKDRARQEGVQRRVEALQFASQQLSVAQERYMAAGKTAQAISTAERIAKIEALIDKAKTDANIAGELERTRLTTTGSMQEVLMRAGLAVDENGNLVQVGPNTFDHSKATNPMMTMEDLMKVQTSLGEALLKVNPSKVDKGTFNTMKTQYLNSMAYFVQGDNVDSPLLRMGAAKDAIGRAYGLDPNRPEDAAKINENIQSLWKIEVSNMASRAQQMGKEDVPGVVGKAVAMGLMPPEDAVRIESWRGREEFIKALKATGGGEGGSGAGEIDDVTGEPMLRPKSSGNAPAPEESPAAKGMHAAGESTPLEKLLKQGPPPEPSYAGLGYRAHLQAEIDYTEGLLQYDSQLRRYGTSGMDEAAKEKLATKLRALRKEAEGYDLTDRGVGERMAKKPRSTK